MNASIVANHAPLTIPAELRSLAGVRAFVRERLAAMGVDETGIADLVQAVDECVTNVIVHGYDGSEGSIDVQLETDDSRVIVRIRDYAGAFDPTAVPAPNPDRPLEDRLHGGMGVPLMRASVDELHHRLLPDGRNELTMIKRIGPAD